MAQESSPRDVTDPLRAAIADAYLKDETEAVNALVAEARLPEDVSARIVDRAARLVEGVRAAGPRLSLDVFLQEYGLSTKEGVALMCLAEALLRIPDAETVDLIIQDKIGGGDWDSHLGQGPSLLVNASTWALMLTGRVIGFEENEEGRPWEFIQNLTGRIGAPVIRAAVTQAMRILGREFVLGRTIEEGLASARDGEARGFRFSFDMLGEAAKTAQDAAAYLAAYEVAIDAVGAARGGRPLAEAPGVSIKLSALHPRYEESQRTRVLDELLPRLQGLAVRAKAAGLGLCIDAEEADRLDLSLDLIDALIADSALDGWAGLGVAVQAYQKRAPYVLDWLYQRAGQAGRSIMVRLVKGAYWDAEIKRAQEIGLTGYPVFTRKRATDTSYLACARKLLGMRDRILPQFATHNAHTIAAVIEMAGDQAGYEFQRLHGMGDTLYDQLSADDGPGAPVRIYAPVGSHEYLLSYLVRRLLENGANTSFVNRLQNATVPVREVVADPVARAAASDPKPHPRIPLPRDLFGDGRQNSAGLDLTDRRAMAPVLEGIGIWSGKSWHWAKPDDPGPSNILSPNDHRVSVGTVSLAGPHEINSALNSARVAAPGWDRTPASDRADCLLRAADALERDRTEFVALTVLEAGKTVADALAEVREAIDFCRYYAARAWAEFSNPVELPGPTGERNEIRLQGRGTFVCISPWNFPLAIFLGQVTAALAAGNAVIAKPAEQTPLMALRAVEILWAAGVPQDVVQVLTGAGATVGAALVADTRVAGVAFTGSTETARAINRELAQRAGPIVPLIAETGGQNVMIVDSSALPEQVTADVITSAFGSAGQRCSALRVLYLQEEVADRMLRMIAGAMAELRVGDPADLSTDVGPVIDEDARSALRAHIVRMESEALTGWSVPLPPACDHGTFVAPHMFEIDGIHRLGQEVFGPILHVIRYPRARLDDVLDAVNATGYGLTLGIHSRIDETVRHINQRLRVGNTYVNRSITGAVVGVQPFGGEGLSGTGPKAGGPRYLHRFATERTLSINTAAAGGNASLVAGLE